jgi:CelD/BcsL family acetyltransferase involved in cellulose biosynthesis
MTVKTDDESTRIAQIRSHVARKVARHEVPHRIVIVDSIPLTVAGKADRKALLTLLSVEPRRDITMAVNEADAPKANSPSIEQIVQECFQRVL